MLLMVTLGEQEGKWKHMLPGMELAHRHFYQYSMTKTNISGAGWGSYPKGDGSEYLLNYNQKYFIIR